MSSFPFSRGEYATSAYISLAVHGFTRIRAKSFFSSRSRKNPMYVELSRVSPRTNFCFQAPKKDAIFTNQTNSMLSTYLRGYWSTIFWISLTHSGGITTRHWSIIVIGVAETVSTRGDSLRGDWILFDVAWDETVEELVSIPSSRDAPYSFYVGERFELWTPLGHWIFPK